MYSLFIHFSHGLLLRLTALVLIISTLPGCLATEWIVNTAQGDSEERGDFALSSRDNAYEITRSFGPVKKTFRVLRHDLPSGCETAQFFLFDSTHELQIAQPLDSHQWVTGGRPPIPDDTYPPCALLVSYGSFSGPPELDGVAVNSTAGLIATSERQQPQLAALALLPLGIIADFFIFIGGVVTSPVLFIVVRSQISEEERKKEAKEKEKSALPLPVGACWTTIDKVMKIPGAFKPEQFHEFEWTPSIENAYVLTTANEVFSGNKPFLIDTRVTLRQGRVQFKIRNIYPIWTDADVECDLRGGDVVATRVMLHK